MAEIQLSSFPASRQVQAKRPQVTQKAFSPVAEAMLYGKPQQVRASESSVVSQPVGGPR